MSTTSSIQSQSNISAHSHQHQHQHQNSHDQHAHSHGTQPKSIWDKPSFYAHVMNGLLMLTALIILIKYYVNIRSLEPYKRLMIVLLFAAVIGIHSLSHNALEVAYGFNPLHWTQQS